MLERAYKSYWVSPSGSVMDNGDLQHHDVVLKHPEKFGLGKQNPNDTPNELNAAALGKGWIRLGVLPPSEVVVDVADSSDKLLRAAQAAAEKVGVSPKAEVTYYDARANKHYTGTGMSLLTADHVRDIPESAGMIKNPKVAGALYDFMGYLTGLPGDGIKVGGKHAVYDVMQAFQDWAKTRNLDIEMADVENWTKSKVKGFVDARTGYRSVAEMLLDLNEFYSVPMDVHQGGYAAAGDGRTVGSSGGQPHPSYDTSANDDPDEGLLSNQGRGSEYEGDDLVKKLGDAENIADKAKKLKQFRSTYETHRMAGHGVRQSLELTMNELGLKFDEDFGLAGLPGGVRDDPESPDSYDGPLQTRLGT